MDLPEAINQEERARREAEEACRALTAHAPCILFHAEVEQHGEKLLWDIRLFDEEAAQRILPLATTPELDYVHAWWESRNREDNARMKGVTVAALQAGESTYSQDYRCTDRYGDERWLSEEVQMVPVALGRWRAVGICMDITDRKRAEAALRDSGARYQFLSATAARLLSSDQPQDFVHDVFRRLSSHLDLEIYVHYEVTEEEHLRLTSYAGLPEHVARRIEWIGFGQMTSGRVAQEKRPIVIENVQEADPDLAQVVRELGITAYACHPLLANGAVVGTLSFGTGKRKRFRPDELELMATVCQQVSLAVERASLIRLLQQQMVQLAEADQRKDEFLAMLAHELRNPLAPILNAVQLMRARPDRSRDEWAREVIQHQVRHLARLIDDLLDVSRISHGKIALRRETVDLRAVVQRAVESARPLLEERRHDLSVSLSPQPLTVEGDPARLEQILVNLLSNSAKYTRPGGHIQVAADVEGGRVWTSVRDDGIGIDPDLLPQVFELFTQAEQGLDRAQGGLGIGLALVKRLVELHGGTVIARSSGPGAGSEFIVRLPALKDEAASSVAQRPTPNAPLPPSSFRLHPSRRVLVVEDNASAAETLLELLELWGHEARIASTGREALALARELRPDVILLDIGLPEMDGYEVARRLAAEGLLDGVLLVAITGYGQEEDRRRALEAGCAFHLTKPVAPEALQDLLAGYRAGPARAQGTEA